MFIKNILFGLGGTAVIGGVGYGIYAVSKSDNKDVKENKEEEGEKNGESEPENGRTNSTGGGADDSSRGGSGR